MRFILLMAPKPGVATEADWTPTVEIVELMHRYNESLRQAGVLLDAEGLHSPAKGALVTKMDGRITVTDGPFAETKEVIAGYWIIEAKSKEEAIEWAKRCPAIEGAVIEVRQVAEFSDFPDDVREAAAKLGEGSV